MKSRQELSEDLSRNPVAVAEYALLLQEQLSAARQELHNDRKSWRDRSNHWPRRARILRNSNGNFSGPRPISLARSRRSSCD